MEKPRLPYYKSGKTPRAPSEPDQNSGGFQNSTPPGGRDAPHYTRFGRWRFPVEVPYAQSNSPDQQILPVGAAKNGIGWSIALFRGESNLICYSCDRCKRLFRCGILAVSHSVCPDLYKCLLFRIVRVSFTLSVVARNTSFQRITNRFSF